MEDRMNLGEGSSQNIQLTGWTKKEKYDLLVAIKSLGARDITSIHHVMPNKSIEEVKTAIDYYMAKAKGSPTVVNEDKQIPSWKRKKMTQGPLTVWANHLSNKFKIDELNNEISTAVRMIAEFEDIPPATATESVDFRELYLLVANALDGKTLPNNTLFKHIIEKCMLEIALESKSFLKPHILKQALNNINEIDESILFKSQSNDLEHYIMMRLITKNNYNPLHIPENTLKYTETN